MNKKLEEIASLSLTALLIFSLLPILYLGRYNHPTGDDYYYGAQSHIVWEETGSITATVAEAARGVAYDYKTWQGTYSSMYSDSSKSGGNFFLVQRFHVLYRIFCGDAYFFRIDLQIPVKTTMV